MYLNVSLGLKCVSTYTILSEMNLGPSGLRKTIFLDDISCVNLIVVWTELAKSIKLLISALGKVHSKDVMDRREVCVC